MEKTLSGSNKAPKKQQKTKKGKGKATKATQKPDIGPYAELVDVDCNLTHEALRDDIDDLIARAKLANIKHMLVPGSTIEESRRSIGLARRHPNYIRTTVGVHPYHVTDCGDLDSAIDELRLLITAPENRAVVSALGETGLDYSDGFPDAAEQLRWFERQVELAVELQIPLFLHIRLAFEDFMRIVRKHEGKMPPVIVHCFTGSEDELRAYVDSGFYISVSGFVCKKTHGEAVRRMLRNSLVPMDRLMLETDAPYLGFPGCRKGFPKPKQQFPNVPTALPMVAAAVADATGIPVAEVAASSTAAARKFFGFPTSS